MRHATRLLHPVGGVALLAPGRRLPGREVLVQEVVLVHHILVIVHVGQAARLGREGQRVLRQGLVDLFVVLNLGESPGIDGLGWVLLLHDAKHTVIQMLVEVLSVGEGNRTGRTLASGVGGVARQFLAAVDVGRSLLPAVWWCLLNTVYGCQVTLEDVRSVERLLGGRARAGTETTHHCPFVVGQGVSVLVVLSCKTFDVVVTGLNRALLWPLSLMGQHVRLQVFEGFPAVGMWASLLLLGLVSTI